VRRGATELFPALKQAVFARPGLLKATPARKLSKLDGGKQA
jgi:hypothetical protein